MVKPFSGTELVARIRGALRRQPAPEPVQPSEPVQFGELTIDYANREVQLAGEPVRLTDIEYRVLAQLSLGNGQAVSYEQLLWRVWGREGSSNTGPVRTIVKRSARSSGTKPSNLDTS